MEGSETPYFKPSPIRHTTSGAEVTGASYENKEYPEQELTKAIIGCAVRVHKELGAGYAECIYEAAMMHELTKCGLRWEQQKPVTVYYDGVPVGQHRADLIVEGRVVLELKCVESTGDREMAQVVSTLKATKIRVGLLINFREAKVTRGIRRVVVGYD